MADLRPQLSDEQTRATIFSISIFLNDPSNVSKLYCSCLLFNQNSQDLCAFNYKYFHILFLHFQWLKFKNIWFALWQIFLLDKCFSNITSCVPCLVRAEVQWRGFKKRNARSEEHLEKKILPGLIFLLGWQASMFNLLYGRYQVL